MILGHIIKGLASWLMIISSNQNKPSTDVGSSSERQDGTLGLGLLQQRSQCNCDYDYGPSVCGSNGKTYENRCKLQCAQRDDPFLRLQHEGKCGCYCSYDYKPVCGSDFKTYLNKCLFNCAQNDKSGLTLCYEGQCGAKPCPHPTSPPTSGTTPRPGGKCGFEYEPICGNDDVTYGNDCMFRLAQFSKPNLRVKYHGTCNSVG